MWALRTVAQMLNRNIFTFLRCEGWLLFGQLELISVNRDKTAQPGDIISFTNHLVSNNSGQEGELWETVGSFRPTQSHVPCWPCLSLRCLLVWSHLKMCPWFLHQAECPLSHPPPQPSHVNKPSAVQTSSEGGWLEIQILIGLNGFLFHYSSADLLV